MAFVGHCGPCEVVGC